MGVYSIGFNHFIQGLCKICIIGPIKKKTCPIILL